MSDTMERSEFLDRLDLYGPDFADWPAADVPAAERRIAEDETARRALAAARELNDGLAALRPAPADAALKSRIEAAMRREAAAAQMAPAAPAAEGGLIELVLGWLRVPAFPGAIAVAASAAIGFMVSTGDVTIDAEPYDNSAEAIVFGDFDVGDTL